MRYAEGSKVGALRWLALRAAPCVGMAVALHCAQAADVSARTLALRDVVQGLRTGGFVLVVTHGASDERDDPAARADDCARQGSLSDLGRLAGSGIGKLLARMQVPLNSIVSSRYCRAAETAERIAANAHVKRLSQVDALDDLASAPPAVAQARASTLRHMANAPPPTRSNTMVVTHKANVAHAFGFDATTVGDGELAIFKPSPGGEPVLVERLQLAEMSALMRLLGPPVSLVLAAH